LVGKPDTPFHHHHPSPDRWHDSEAGQPDLRSSFNSSQSTPPPPAVPQTCALHPVPDLAPQKKFFTLVGCPGWLKSHTLGAK